LIKRQSKHRSSLLQESIRKKRKHNNDVKYVKIICYIVLGYSITTLPTTINELVKILRGPQSSTINEVTSIMMYTNGFVDVLVYSCLDVDFKDHVKRSVAKMLFFGSCKSLPISQSRLYKKPSSTISRSRSTSATNITINSVKHPSQSNINFKPVKTENNSGGLATNAVALPENKADVTVFT